MTAPARSIDELVAQIQAHLGLEADTEYEVLEEIRGHLEESVQSALLQGRDPHEALRAAAEDFGIVQTAQALRETHQGWGMREALVLAAVPVLATIVMRWLIFAPGGTAVAWRVLLSWPNLIFVALLVLLVPLWQFAHRRYAMVLWLFFWSLSLSSVVWAKLRW